MVRQRTLEQSHPTGATMNNVISVETHRVHLNTDEQHRLWPRCGIPAKENQPKLYQPTDRDVTCKYCLDLCER